MRKPSKSFTVPFFDLDSKAGLLDSKSTRKIKESESKDSKKTEEPSDLWEMISQTDIDLDGMQDPFEKKFSEVRQDYKERSVYGREYGTWTLKPLIVKSNDDLRQEVLALQLMKRLAQIFEEVPNLNIYLRPYDIFVTSSNSGFLEFIPDTCSVDFLKKRFP